MFTSLLRREVKNRPFSEISTNLQINHCGSIDIQLNGQLPEIFQQAELPEVKAAVTEYQLLKYGCDACGKNSVATLPVGIPDSAFGPRLMGLLVTLTWVFHLAKREAVQLIKELYDADVGIGSVSNIEERVAQALDPIYSIFKAHKYCLAHLIMDFHSYGERDSPNKRIGKAMEREATEVRDLLRE